MTREEYFICLEKYLKDLSIEELREAIDYYENYFDEAGPDKEAEVIEKLGSPKQLAETILKSEGIETKIPDEEINSGENNTTAVKVIEHYDSNGYKKADDERNSSANTTFAKNEKDDKTFKIIIAIVVFIVALPVITSAGGVLIGLICGLGFGGIGLVLGGVAGAIGSLILMFKGGVGLGIMGVGITVMLAAAGLFCLFLLYVLCKYFVPICIDGIKKLWNVIVK